MRVATARRILILASEAAPFAKTGGLADVVGSLPKALAARGHDVRVVMPAHAEIARAARSGRWNLRPSPLRLRVPIGGGMIDAGVLEATLPGSTAPIFFIAERNLFERPQIYGYDDDPYRFAFFSRAALDLVVAAQGWRPDIVHAHDWHAAPAIAWLATAGRFDPRYRGLPTVFTIHNLRHQGRSPRNALAYLGIDAPPLVEEGPSSTNFMARAIYHATMISTVSPTYAREILTPAYGEGLDALLRYRHFDVHGILNGLDYEVWHPGADTHLASTYNASTLEKRAANKLALQERLGLEIADVPLVTMVTRLDAQKGLDIAGHAIHLLLNAIAGEAQFAVLGSGAPEFETMFGHLAAYHSRKMAAVLRYDAALAPLMYAGSDLFLMPSRFEPCGLGQMIAMRYGSVPVVRQTGGLADTVHEGETGFSFVDYTSDALWQALARGVSAWWHNRNGFRQMQQRGMAADFSWATSAGGYEQLFEWAIARERGW
jgi:starch synthase